MKKLKSLYLPAAVVLMAVGAAVAGHTAKSSQASEPGYYFDSSANECKSPSVNCSSDPGDLCTWTDQSTLVTYELHSIINETTCDDNTLYKQR
ncbi:MAG: DUF6520 family protein [Mangrovibacterium sp.]